MATANSTAALNQPSGKALAANAMGDLCKFLNSAKDNPLALNAWNEYLEQERPVIEVSIQSDGQAYFFLSKPLASFIGTGVAA